MRLAGQRSSGASVGGRGPVAARFLNGQLVQGLVIAAIAAGLYWLVWLYGTGLRDTRYLDGWILAGGMGFQLYFHIARKKGSLSPKSAVRWRKFHIFLGYLLVAAFLLHSDFSLPDTAFEWALWAGFVLVTLSGILGTYLAWSLQANRWTDESIGYERIPARRAELARDIRAVVSEADPAAAQLPLPGLPHDDWIKDLYTNHLRAFFQGPRNSTAHLIGSQRPLRRLMDEIDGLSRYVDRQGQEKLAAIKELVVEKDRLDFAHVYLGMSRALLFVHVPVTYALIVLGLLHFVVVYAFSAGFW